MKQYFIVLFLLIVLCFSSTLFADPELKRVIKADSIEVEISWESKETLNTEQFLDTLLNMAIQDKHIKTIDKIGEKIEETNKDIVKKTTKIVKYIYYYVKFQDHRAPEALITLKVETLEFDKAALENTKIKLNPNIQISLTKPCELYTNHHDFFLENFDIDSINLEIQAQSNEEKWIIKTKFQFKNLFLLRWLQSARELLKLKEEPQSHNILLFFKDRFEEFSQNLYKHIQKG